MNDAHAPAPRSSSPCRGTRAPAAARTSRSPTRRSATGTWPTVHRLHADDEGVRQGAARPAASSPRGRRGCRRAKCNVYAARPRRRARGESCSRKRSAGPVPAPGCHGSGATAGRREVALLGARRRAPAGSTPHDDAAPRAVALRVLRGVADRVLARQLVRDLAVDARCRSSTRFGKNVRPPVSWASCRSTNSASLNPLSPTGSVGRPQADRVDRRFRPLRPVPAPPRTAAGSRCPRRPRAATMAWRRISSDARARRPSSGPSARCRRRCTATSTRRPRSCGWPSSSSRGACW